jgi:hypothetical protein
MRLVTALHFLGALRSLLCPAESLNGKYGLPTDTAFQEGQHAGLLACGSYCLGSLHEYS